MARQTIQNANASLYFNGSSSLMTSPVVPSPTGFSFAMWMKLTNPKAGSARIIDYSNSGPSGGLTIAVNSSMRPELVIYDGASTTTALPITSSGWVHVAGTYIPNSAKLYLNGELAATDSVVNMSAPTQTLTFGRRSASAANFASVFLSQAVLHNTTTPWTAAQVLALYNNGTVPTGATAVYPLNEGAGSIAYDTSGNGNNGTITAGTWTRDTPTKTRKGVNGNMVYNGDFEIAPVVNVAATTPARYVDGTVGGSTTNSVFGWYYSSTSGTATTQFDRTVANSGIASLKASTTAAASSVVVTGTQAASGGFAFGYQALPNTSYTASVLVKTSLVSGSSVTGAGFKILERNGVLSSVATDYVATNIVTTTGWTRYTATFTTNAATRYLLPACEVIGTDGTATLIMDAWFDDIQLYPTTPITRSAATGRLTATGRSAA